MCACDVGVAILGRNSMLMKLGFPRAQLLEVPPRHLVSINVMEIDKPRRILAVSSPDCDILKLLKGNYALSLT